MCLWAFKGMESGMASGPELVEESRVGGGLGAAGFWRMRGREG